MQCPNCRQSVAAWADFCPHCGARQPVLGATESSTSVEAAAESVPESISESVPESVPESVAVPAEPSLLDEVFLSPATAGQVPGFDATPVMPLPVAAPPTQEDGGLGGVGGVGGVGDTADLPAAQEPVAAIADRYDGGSHLGPAPAGAFGVAPDGPVGAPAGPPEDPHARRPNRTGAVIVAIAGLFVTAALVLAAWSMLKVGDSSTSGGSDTAGGSSASAGASGVASPGAPAASGSGAASTPGGTPSPLPATAKACGTSGSGDAAAVFAGDNTSCEFALAVGTAYAAAVAHGSQATVTAHSPVTNQDYTLSCAGSLPAVCTTGNATVYLTRPS